MAYTDTQHTHKRLAGMTGVALVHIALAFGLAAGLTITQFEVPDEARTTGNNIIVDLPPPPPPPEEVVEPTEKIVPAESPVPQTAPTTVLDLTPTAPQVVIMELPQFGPIGRIVSPPIGGEVPRDPVRPVHVPTDPIPANGPTGWVTTNDYPTRALMRGWEGDLTYALDVAANGRVEECRVVNSSGRSILDRAACNVIERRARFEPATNASGANIAGTYRGSVSWLIPEG